MNRKNVGVVVFAWDTLWKLIAVLVAVRNRQFKWIVPLLVVNSVGILPMVYLWKFSGPRAEDIGEMDGPDSGDWDQMVA